MLEQSGIPVQIERLEVLGDAVKIYPESPGCQICWLGQCLAETTDPRVSVVCSPPYDSFAPRILHKQHLLITGFFHIQNGVVMLGRQAEPLFFSPAQFTCSKSYDNISERVRLENTLPKLFW